MRYALLTALAAGVVWASVMSMTLMVGSKAAPPGFVVMIGVATAIIGLAAIGSAQWIELRHHTPAAHRWIPWTALAWTIALPWSFTPAPFVDESTPIASHLALWGCAGLLMANVMALITWQGLAACARATLRRPCQRHQPNGGCRDIAGGNEDVPAGIYSAVGTLLGILLSGPLAFAVVNATHPQPPWKSAEVFARSYHPVQIAPHLGGIVLVAALVALVASTHAIVPQQAVRRFPCSLRNCLDVLPLAREAATRADQSDALVTHANLRNICRFATRLREAKTPSALISSQARGVAIRSIGAGRGAPTPRNDSPPIVSHELASQR